MFVITAFRSPDNATWPRKCFWQTCWARRAPQWQEIGGWMPTSYHATRYASHGEAESVRALLGLEGEVLAMGQHD